MTWQWVVGVTMAAGQVVAIRKEKEGAYNVMYSSGQ